MRPFILVITAACLAASGTLTASCSSASTSVVAPSADKCQVAVTSSATTFSATGGTGTVTIATARDCTWSVASDAPWVSIAGEHGGQGEAEIPYTVAPNGVPVSRSGAIVVGTQKVQLSQAGAPCR